jgi:DNA-binding beta-propeller fold protein YncE/PKD repeat protein
VTARAERQAETSVEVLVANGLGETLSSLAIGESETLVRDCMPTGLAPSHLVVQGGEGYLVNSLSHTVQVIDLAGKRTLRTVSVGLGRNPMALALVPGSDGPRAYVSEFIAGEVDCVNLGPGGGVEATIRLPQDLPRDAGVARTRPFPGSLALGDGVLFVACANLRGDAGGLRAGGPGVVAVIDAAPASPAFHTVTDTIVLRGRDTAGLALPEELPGMLLVAAAGDYADGFKGNGMLEVIECATHAVVAFVPLAGFRGGVAPLEVVVAGGRGYLADAMRGRVITFDVEALRRAITAAPALPVDARECLRGAIELPGTGGPLSYASGLAVNDGEIFVLEFNHDRLFVIDREREEITRSYIVGDGPDAVAVWRRESPPPEGRAVAGYVWFGRVEGGEITAAPLGAGGSGQAAPIGRAGRFVLELPAGEYLCGAAAAEYRSLRDGIARPWPAPARLLGAVRGRRAAVTPLSHLAARLDEEIAGASRRLARHFGIDIEAFPDDPLTPPVEGDRQAGIVMAALALAAETLAPANPIEFLDALAEDGADGRFDGLRGAAPIVLAGAPLPARAACDLIADAAERFQRAPENASGGTLPEAMLAYLRETSGVLPPEEGAYDWRPPHADAGGDREAVRGRPILFSGAASSDDDAIARYDWCFDAAGGFRVQATGMEVAHAFAFAGVYTVALRVRDRGGNEAFDAVVVTVREEGEVRLAVVPAETYLRRGEQVRLRAFWEGEEAAAQWRSGAPWTAAVSAGGRVAALGAGYAVVTAEHAGVRGEALVWVDLLPTVTFDEGTVYAAPPGGGCLEIDGAEGVAEIALPPGFAAEAVGVWGRRYVLAAGPASLLAADLRTGAVVRELALHGVAHLAPGGDYIWTASGGALAAIGGDDLQARPTAFLPDGDPITALAEDWAGRLWVARGERVVVAGPEFHRVEGAVHARGPVREFAVEGACIAGFCFSHAVDFALAWDGERDCVYLVRGAAAAPDSTWTAESRVIAPNGAGLSNLYRQTDGRFVAESRRGGLVYVFALRGDGTIEGVAASGFSQDGRRERWLASRERRPRALFASVLLGYEPRGLPGAYMNPLLALGEPRGAGVESGGTHVTSLGDRDAPWGPSAPGRGGSITLGFEADGREALVFDGPGFDLVVFENAFAVPGGGMFCEALIVQVSQDGRLWHEFPWRIDPRFPVDNPARFQGLAGRRVVRANGDPGRAGYAPIAAADPAAGGDRFDLAELGLGWIRYVRLVDAGGEVEDGGAAPMWAERGADVDAVAALHHARDPRGRERDRIAPVAVITPSTTAPAPGQEVTLSGAASYDDGPIVFYAWALDLQEGDFTLVPGEAFRPDAVGPEARLTMPAEGSVRAALLVIDRGGNTGRAEVRLEPRAP